MRGRSYSYSPSPPPRSYSSRRRRSPSPPKGRSGGGRGRDLRTSLLVLFIFGFGGGFEIIPPEDLRGPFGQFGPLKDIYLPRDYYTGDPRGIGFVQFVDPADAADAKYYMDGQILLGRELTVVFAEENRKNPSEMRQRDRGRSSDSRSSVYSRSPRYARTYSRSPAYYSPRSRWYSRSISPRDRRYRERSYSRSPYGSRSHSLSRSYSRSRSQSPDYSR